MNKIFIISFILATGAVAFITYRIVYGVLKMNPFWEKMQCV